MYPRYKGPDIPGMVHVGNSGFRENPVADMAIQRYVDSLKAIPREAFQAIDHNFGDCRMWAVYCEVQYAPIVERWTLGVEQDLRLWSKMLGRGDGL